MRAHQLRWLTVLLLGPIGFALAAAAESEPLVDTSCTYSILRSFGQPGPGGNPNAKLLQASDGALYGTTEFGGSNSFGTIFRLSPDENDYTVLAHFDSPTTGAHPLAPLMEGTDGALYGTTSDGGADGVGTIFRINKDGTGFVVLLHLAGAAMGSYPYAGLLQGSDGALYGAASEGGDHGMGTVFRLNTDGTGFAVLKHLDGFASGSYPYGDLIEGEDRRLYGTTYGGGNSDLGTVFALNTDGTGFTLLKHFDGSSSGAILYAGLVQGTDGSLYGAAREGGTSNHGTVFRLRSDGSAFSVLKHLDHLSSGAYPTVALIEGTDGALYGTTTGGGGFDGAAFKLNPDGSGFTTLAKFPDVFFAALFNHAGLIQATDGTIYGVTPEGGFGQAGMVYKLTTGGSGHTIVFDDFSTDPDMSDGGGLPAAGLIQATDGALYGTTQAGGSFGFGTVFKVNPNGTGFLVLKNFDLVPSGGSPIGELIQGTDGALYGTTLLGGTSGQGTVFKLNLDGSGFTILVNFTGGPGGLRPVAGLLQAADGALYGTTSLGGNNGDGTVFKVNRDGTGFTVLKHFLWSTTGSLPFGQLLQGIDGALYGTTLEDGNGSAGTVFKLNPDGSGFTILKHFTLASGGAGVTGGGPRGLYQGNDGTLYGVCNHAGTGGAGTVFKLGPTGTGFAVLHNFDRPTTGANPTRGLIRGIDGLLYGTTSDGGSDDSGTIFKLELDGSGFTVLRNFSRLTTGAMPLGRLVQAANGLIYGTVREGASVGAGAVFGFDPFVDHNPPVARCANVTIPAEANCTADASIDDGSFDPDAGDRLTLTQDPAGPYPLGETTVTLTVTDRGCQSSTCTATVTVSPGTPCDDGNACTVSDTCQLGAGCTGGPLDCDDGNCCTVDSCEPASGCGHAPYLEPPTIVEQPDLDGGGGSCPGLWPPQHGYVDFTRADTGIEAQAVCGGLTYSFSSCASSQAEDQSGTADGNTTRDCVYEPEALHLRAERDGTCSPKGRTYTMTMIATDACGNSTTSAPFTACVWHDRGHAPSSSAGRIYSASPGSNTRPGTNGTYGTACGDGCGLICGEPGQVHDSSDDDRPNLVLTVVSSGGVRLDWAAPVLGDPYPPNANYEIWRRVRGSGPYTKLAEVPHDVTTYLDTEAVDGSDYEWSVNALY